MARLSSATKEMSGPPGGADNQGVDAAVVPRAKWPRHAENKKVKIESVWKRPGTRTVPNGLVPEGRERCRSSQRTGSIGHAVRTSWLCGLSDLEAGFFQWGTISDCATDWSALAKSTER